MTCWGGTYKTTLKPLIYDIQNRIIKGMTSNKYMDKPIYIKYTLLEVMPVHHMYVYHLLQFMVTTNKYVQVKQKSIYPSRDSGDKYIVPMCKKEIMHKHYYYLGPKIYNTLPTLIRRENRIPPKMSLIKEYFTTIKDLIVD